MNEEDGGGVDFCLCQRLASWYSSEGCHNSVIRTVEKSEVVELEVEHRQIPKTLPTSHKYIWFFLLLYLYFG